MVKNLPVNAGDMRDVGSNPGSRSSPEDGMTTHSGILALARTHSSLHGGVCGSF